MVSHSEQVHVALYSKLHSARPARGGVDGWAVGLPVLWRDAVVVPEDTRRFSDYEASAFRLVGYDTLGEPCYVCHAYRYGELRSDDGEEFYEETVHAEAGRAWRLRDGRWLLWRRVERGWGEEPGFFSFSEEMPR